MNVVKTIIIILSLVTVSLAQVDTTLAKDTTNISRSDSSDSFHGIDDYVAGIFITSLAVLAIYFAVDGSAVRERKVEGGKYDKP